jgi:hypothetical protein
MDNVFALLSRDEYDMNTFLGHSSWLKRVIDFTTEKESSQNLSYPLFQPKQ